jgi:DNA invertase Pin-like site-specific DNA recombinase
MLDLSSSKIKIGHLNRSAFLYIRQSTFRQVYENAESGRRQYALKEKLVSMGWDEASIKVIDGDTGRTGDGSVERHGFQHLVSEVSLGRAGIVAGIEVSRLARCNSDWHKLLQIAALSDTLILDEDGIYDVNDFNDRILLGLKGTMSEAELHFQKARMRGGLLNKAKRGELKRTIPIGYIYDENDLIVKDPDAQVQEAISRFFNTFKRVGSAYSLVREYGKQGLLFPCRQFKGHRLGELSWEGLGYAKALQMLKNPVYAGIYAYGMTQTQNTPGGRKRKAVPKEQYHAWLPNSHPAYISEDQFDENVSQLAKNNPASKNSGHGGAVREGSALLQGIAICGICGKLMTLRYNNSKYAPQPIYQCSDNSRHRGGVLCQSVLGGNIDHAIGSLLLEVINPLTLDAAVSIQQEMAGRKDEIVKLYSQQMERARYEMDLAKRRYLRVDPDNRLVAAELEYDWDQKARAYESAKMAYNQKCEAEIQAVDNKLKKALEQMVCSFPKIWNDPQTSSKEKKRIARLIIEDVTITADLSKIVLGVRFKGGSTETIEIPRLKNSLIVFEREQMAVAEIKALLSSGLTYTGIAKVLNEKSLINGGSSKPFDASVVSRLINRHGLPKQTDIIASSSSEGWLTAKEKMAELGIDKSKLYKMRKSGKLICKKCIYHGHSYLYKSEETLSM